LGIKDSNSIALAELFPQADEHDLSGYQLRFEGLEQEAAARLVFHLGLAFISDPVRDSSNVCQANAGSVLPAYRTAVTAREIFSYLLAVLEDGPLNAGVIPYPSEPEVF
jgi:hypothetical protein